MRKSADKTNMAGCDIKNWFGGGFWSSVNR